MLKLADIAVRDRIPLCYLECPDFQPASHHRILQRNLRHLPHLARRRLWWCNRLHIRNLLVKVSNNRNSQ
jgi:hypothetical protein